MVQIFIGKRGVSEKNIQSSIPKSTGEQTLGDFNVVGSDINNRTLGVTESFTINFSKPISGPVYTLEPEEQINLHIEAGSSLRVEPKQAWKFDTAYIFTLKRESIAQDGSLLSEDYVFKFKTNPYSGI